MRGSDRRLGEIVIAGSGNQYPAARTMADDHIRALGAATRICGPTLLPARTRVTPPRTARAMFEAVVGHALDERAFVRAYKRVEAAVPLGKTVVCVGSSLDRFAFMFECVRGDVIYMPFSRDGFARLATQAQKRRWARDRLRDAGIDPYGDGSRFAFLDWAFMGGTLDLLGEVAPRGSCVVAVACSSDLSLKWPIGRKFVVDGSPWTDLGSPVDPCADKVGNRIVRRAGFGKTARCVPHVVGSQPVPLEPARVAACNAGRLWILKMAARLRRERARRNRRGVRGT